MLDVPRAGRLSVHADGQELARAEPQGSGQAQALPFDIPEGARHLEVVADGRGATVLGVVLQHQRPGIVLDTLGVPSADANLFLRAREDIFRTQLAERSPRLLLFILGGNEAKRLEWGRSKLAEVEEGLRTFVRRSRAAAPGSACLVVGPIDAVRGGNGPKKLAQRPYLDEVISIERQIALSEGCAFFDIFSAMGGSGSLARFVDAGLVHEDLVHPRGHGLDILGQLITDALLRSWVDAADPRRQAALAPPLQASEETR
ncbi:GDSL-type esterase/lipase family protein [Archangium gephyra]|uniref:GDSL-type esterase/lipase family protein n=1 Tax=Archangium gephyra TaxID=48 RepID=UPI001FE18E23|nr:GDSL-type esterase/lipase family protein [Archangium gephyra]